MELRSLLELKILINCCTYHSPEINFAKDEWESEAGRSCRSYFLDAGVIDRYGRATPKGKAWLDYILTTPMPVEKWIMPERDEE